jgi:signal-transduction protein with cAMP-binding, CBS, and nucleotidyltransferase domain
MKVERLLKKKGSVVCSVEPQALVYDALEKMDQENIGALLVMQGDKVEGIFTERDYARKVILKGKYSKDIMVRDVMTSLVCYVTKERNMHECLALMTEKHFRHLPVIEDKQLLGLISITDVVKAIIDEQDHEIADYENYIRGWN